MACATARVQVHLLDPIPGIVVARVLDGLRALGMDAVLSGTESPTEPRIGKRASARRVCLTSRRDARSAAGAQGDALRAPVVALPALAGTSRFDAGVATAVLEQVVEQLERLPAAT